MASGAKKSRKLLATSSSPNHSNNNSGDEVESGGTSNREGSEEFEPGSWECTVCTFRNKYEAFKCLMCDTRKGTSTRKPRLNPSVVQQQTLVQKLAAVEQKKQRHSSEARNSPDLFVSPLNIGGNNSSAPITPSNNGHRADFLVAGPSTSTSTAKLSKRRPIIPFRDALVVRSSAKRMVVTVEGRNFTITEFKPRTSPRGRKKLSANTSINSPLSAAKTSSASTPLKTTKEQ